MKSRGTVVLVILLVVVSNLFGQNAKHNKLLQFDDEKFKELMLEFKSSELDFQPKQDELVASNISRINVKPLLFEVNEEDMAPMPKMGIAAIDPDMRHHIRIKKYEMQYPPSSTNHSQVPIIIKNPLSVEDSIPDKK